MKEKFKRENAVTLVALVITIIILLLLAGIAIATIGGKNGIFAKVKQAKKAQLEAEMKEQLTMGLQELQVAKKGEATLDDVTQDWANEVILKDYNPELKEDSSYNGKMMVMTKDKITGKFMIDQNLNITKAEYNSDSLEFEYTTKKRNGNEIELSIKVRDKINGIKQIDYPNKENQILAYNRKDYVAFDYTVELGKEYKFTITTGDGNQSEKTIKIDEYFYNISKNLAEGSSIDNNAIKASYNKSYEAIINTENNYIITVLTVTMDGQTVTTSGNDIIDSSTGKIYIEKVTGDINITVTTKKLEIQYTAIAVNTDNSASNTISLDASTQTKGTTLYINIIATLESNTCTAVLKEDNSKAVPYAVTSNGKYTFIVTGTYNGKTISEEKEVVVNQYQAAKNVVQYDAGDWTEDEIQELKNQKLYDINKEKTVNEKFKLDDDSGINFTFGGFTYKGDSNNVNSINDGTVVTSRNKSVAPESGAGTPKYDGWQILESEEKEGKIYVKKIVHSGTPENFIYNFTADYDNFRVEYILSSGLRRTAYNKLNNGKEMNARTWQMYIDKNQKDLIANTTDKDGNTVKDIHAMTYDEAAKINGNTIATTGTTYWLATAHDNVYYAHMFIIYYSNGTITTGGIYDCRGIRPVVTMADGVYIKSGTGTDSDPYVLGKD